MAARIWRELGIDVEMVRGRYGEFKVLADGETLVDGGALAMLGVLPSGRKIVDAVRARLGPAGGQPPGASVRND